MATALRLASSPLDPRRIRSKEPLLKRLPDPHTLPFRELEALIGWLCQQPSWRRDEVGQLAQVARSYFGPIDLVSFQHFLLEAWPQHFDVRRGWLHEPARVLWVAVAAHRREQAIEWQGESR